MKLRIMLISFAIATFTMVTGCQPATGNKTDEVPLTDSTLNETSEFFEDTGRANSFQYNLLEDYAILDTKEKLYDAFSKNDIEDGETWMAEGTVKVNYSLLKDPTTGNKLRFLWEEDNISLYMLEADYILYNEDYTAIDSQYVESECGMYTGMPLTDLVTLNGADFSFSGFGWDYGGAVWANENTPIGRCNIGISLSYDYESFSDNMDDLMGDQEVRTDMEAVKKVPIYINSLSLRVGKFAL